MNKLIKGSIAGAAGIALLLGGAGTLASWNSDAGLDSTTIQSGKLTIDANGVASAAYQVGGIAAGVVTSSSLLVPGDVVAISQPVNIAASGDNLKATLSVDTAALLTTGAELADFVTFTYTAFAGTTGITGLGLTEMSAATAASIDRVEVVATFAADNEQAQGMTLNLDAVKVLLQQVV